MSPPNNSNSFSGSTAYFMIFLMLAGAWLGHAMGRADREDSVQQQNNEQQSEQKKANN